MKAGAYVKQKLGFTDVRRLEHGVVAYERWAAGSGESRFEGENFVFDKRVDAVGSCDVGLGPGGATAIAKICPYFLALGLRLPPAMHQNGFSKPSETFACAEQASIDIVNFRGV